MKFTAFPAKLARRLLRWAEDLETGPPACMRRGRVDCYATVKALHRLTPGPLHVLYDVGANRGSWAQVFAAFFPELRHAVMFEPGTHWQADLQALRLNDATITIAPVALGRAPGTAMLAGGGASASLLPAGTMQEQFFPGSLDETRQPVAVETLNGWVSAHAAPTPDLVKIDVQGAELDVLTGAEQTLQSCRWLVIELSAVSLYEGQPRAGAVLDWLEQRGWRMAGIGYRWESVAHELLQFDAILTRRPPR